ncbi:MAG: tetratricopeptide repeat protein [Thermoanaerobaculaceae bacterium]|nr:tetratricopeptide repeat protein [Thermoanaerobaculaceae bacterium]TAM56059.1 MAG: tetratricopeptide repeat protein [Acidobacteriota bacterium]
MRDPLRCLSLLGALVLLGACASSKPAPANLPPEIDPNDPLAATMLMQQGQALVAEGKIPDGMAKFKLALSIQPKNPTVYNLIGMAELQSGKPAKALDAFNSALTLAPQYSDARNNRGAAYIQLGQYAMAEADFLAVLGDPTEANRAGVYFNLGSLYFSRGNLAAAEENLRRAAVPTGPVEAYFMLGQVEERLGQPARAETAYRDAMSRAPERADIVFALGKLLETKGRKDEAMALFRRVIALAPNSAEAQQARARLE